MILIADSGSTKTDWIILNNNYKEILRIKTLGLNPAVLSSKDLEERIANNNKLLEIKDTITQIYFYGAGCGTPKPIKTLENVLKNIFINANIEVDEDLLGAIYACSGKKPAIVSILGTGSNSCFYNGRSIETSIPSLGYLIMDEASGNYFGKALLRDYFYTKMPKNIISEFEKRFNTNIDFIKEHLYKEASPNMYLANFAKIMFEFKDTEYIKNLIKKGFEDFFEHRILTLRKNNTVPIYFVGSIAYYFRNILDEVAESYKLKITDVIQRPIDNLVLYHKELTQ